MSQRLLPLIIVQWLWFSHKKGLDNAPTSASFVPRPTFLASERGSSLLEMVFVIMFFLAIIGGVADFGGAFEQYIVITNAAREGARRYAILPCKSNNQTGVTEEVQQTVLGELASAIEDAVIGEPGGGNVTLGASNVIMTPDPRSGCPAAGTPIVVAVELDYPVQFLSLIHI